MAGEARQGPLDGTLSGAATDAGLRVRGYDDEQIADLRTRKVVG